MVHGSDTETTPAVRAKVKSLSQGKLCVYRSGIATKRRKFCVLTKLGPSHNLGVYNSNVNAIERALSERFFLCQVGTNFEEAPSVAQAAFSNKHFKQFRADVLAHMPSLPRLSYPETVALYRGPKRRVYEKAYQSIIREHVTKRDARLSLFVKFEKQDISKAPRGINPRDPRYNLALARYLKHAEHHFFDAINQAFGSRTRATVIKGYNVADSAQILRDKWIQFTDPVAVGLDAKKFDMHVSRAALKYEHSFYKALFCGDNTLSELLAWQLDNTGVAYAQDGKVKFRMQGKRASGDINTSLGNCLLMCGMVFAYARERRIKVELANNGDDCVVFMERCNLRKFQRILDLWFMKRGFRMVAEEPCTVFEEIEFCQSHPVHCVDGWRMVRNHSAVLTKDPMCLVPVPNDKTLRKWCGAVGECGLALAGNVPVQASFYGLLRRHGLPASEAFKSYIYRNRSMLANIRGLTHSSEIDDRARVSYYLAYGVLPDLQRCLESRFESMSILPLGSNLIERSDLRCGGIA